MQASKSTEYTEVFLKELSNEIIFLYMFLIYILYIYIYIYVFCVSSNRRRPAHGSVTFRVATPLFIHVIYRGPAYTYMQSIHQIRMDLGGSGQLGGLPPGARLASARSKEVRNNTDP
jgi:hypothetical protein